MGVRLELWEPMIGVTRFVVVDKTTVQVGDIVEFQGHLYDVRAVEAA